MSDDLVRREDAERIIDAQILRLHEIEVAVWRRIRQRVRNGDDPRIAAAEEVHRALAQLDAVDAQARAQIAALPGPQDA